MRYALDQSPVCSECSGEQSIAGIEKQYTKICDRCKIEFCIHYASKIDFHYCGNCMNDVEMEVTDVRARDCRTIKLSGSDFYFAQQSIHNMSDLLIDFKIEYFQGMLGALLLERQERKVERQQRLAKVKLNFVRPANADETGAIKEPKVKTKKAESKSATVAAALTALLGHVPTEAELKAFMMLAGSK